MRDVAFAQLRVRDVSATPADLSPRSPDRNASEQDVSAPDAPEQAGRVDETGVASWRLRREATAATWDTLQERVRAQRALCEALWVERAHVVATAQSLAAECAVLRDAVRAERAGTRP